MENCNCSDSFEESYHGCGCMTPLTPTVSPVRLLDVAEVLALFSAEQDPSGKTSWYRFQHHRRRTEQWDKLEFNGKLVGFIHWAMKTDNTRTIYDLVVHRDYRRRGFGSALIRHVGTPALVRTATAQAFFEKLGFVNMQDNQRRTMFYLDKEFRVIDTTKPWILTYTGKAVNPLDMKPEDICIQDIAHALACVNRFAGHVAKPITVAQHSVLVSKLATSPGNSYFPSGEEKQKVALQGLLHDAAEAYLGDMTKWVKASMPVFCEAENRLQRTIFQKFGCDETLHEMVERGDRVMVMYEAAKGFGKAWPNHLNDRPGYEPITESEFTVIGKWAPLPWRAAEDAFLVRFRACTAK
jgi:GNAT superfamily N-acetyltransferase